jgi:hypothetical protein
MEYPELGIASKESLAATAEQAKRDANLVKVKKPISAASRATLSALVKPLGKA